MRRYEPEVLEMEDGSLGYFYTLQQLEEINLRRIYVADDKYVRQMYNDRPLSSGRNSPEGFKVRR